MLRGSGMTSQRTRKRMVERLEARGIQDARVLALMARMPAICSLKRPWPAVPTRIWRCPSALDRRFPSPTWWRA